MSTESNTSPLFSAARDELARKANFTASALRIVANDAALEGGESPEWFNLGFLRDASDVILALLAAVERGAEDTRDAERWRFIRDNGLGENLRASDGLMELRLGYDSRPVVFKTGKTGDYTDKLLDLAVDNAIDAARATPTGADHAE